MKARFHRRATVSFFFAFLMSALCILPVNSQDDSKVQAHPAARGTPRKDRVANKALPSYANSAGAWAPPDIDEQVLPVASDASCSLPQVLQGVSHSVKQLMGNLDRFTATERIEHREVDKNGRLRPPKARSFDYLVSIAEIRPGILIAEESRSGNISANDFPTNLASLGMVALALVFHPYYVVDHEVTCEGLGQWRGRTAWQLRFQERPDKLGRDLGFRLGNHSYPVRLKGRAWVAENTYQLLGLETDLVEPVPKIRLLRHHLVIEYRPVQFTQRNVELWLPRSAEMYLDLRGHRYLHQHTYTQYQLFSVDVNQQIQDPAQP